MKHISVLIKEVEQCLSLKAGNLVVDATLGLGGHSKVILENIGQNGKLIAFDQDLDNLNEAKKRLKEFENQVVYIKDNFRHLKNRLKENGIEKVDAILFDLGLCSTHVDISERGFSFQKEGNLDMRFNNESGISAADVVNTYELQKLTDVFRFYGEEKSAYKLATAICERRKTKLFETTTELADFVKEIYPKVRLKVHPATKIFQGIRLEVNDELNALKEGLSDAFNVLNKGGRVVIISYHSLEDRIVKQFFKTKERPLAEASEQVFRTFSEPLVEKIHKKPIVPSEKELLDNPRSRSAKLRAYIKLI